MPARMKACSTVRDKWAARKRMAKSEYSAPFFILFIISVHTHWASCASVGAW